MTFYQTTKDEKHNITKNDKNRHFLAFLSIFEHFLPKKKFFYKNNKRLKPELTKTLKKRPFIKF